MPKSKPVKKKRAPTATSSFGVTGRIGHDSAKFYSRKLYSGRIPKEDQSEHANGIGEYRNTVLCADSADLGMIPDSSVHLMVTSPPYNVGKDYDKDMDMEQYTAMLDSVFAETHRLLVNGGRACINIANVGRKPYIPYHSFVISSMLRNGFLMRGEIIWEKGAGAGASTAWGSWMSATNPALRDTHEYILVFSKGKFSRKAGKNTISRSEFLEYTKSVWRFAAESARRVNHPAPFPVELPYRCIQLYTFEDDVVFDPFCGSGTTAIAAIRTGRSFLMTDSSRKYAAVAKKRIKDELAQTKLA